MKCEKRAAKDMPVSARYAPILVCASTDQGFVGLTREAGVTASDLEDGLWWRPLEPAVKEQLGGLWEVRPRGLCAWWIPHVCQDLGATQLRLMLCV